MKRKRREEDLYRGRFWKQLAGFWGMQLDSRQEFDGMGGGKGNFSIFYFILLQGSRKKFLP